MPRYAQVSISWPTQYYAISWNDPMREFFIWLNDQLLRMQWLSDLVTWLLRDGLGLDVTSRIGGSVHFFIYDVLKIFILLSVLIFTTSYIQSYFPPERTRRILGQHQGLGPTSSLPFWGQSPRSVRAHRSRSSSASPLLGCLWV